MKPGDRVKMTALGREQFPHPRTIRRGVVESITPAGIVRVRISGATVTSYHPDFWELEDVLTEPPR